VKALTICQPYAELIARGLKLVENRTWPTSYRGQLLIHAGKSTKWLRLDCSKKFDAEYGIPLDEMSFGAIVATAVLSACIPVERIIESRSGNGRLPPSWRFLETHEHVEGPYCFVLEDVNRIEPIPYRGAQGFFEVSVPPFDAEAK